MLLFVRWKEKNYLFYQTLFIQLVNLYKITKIDFFPVGTIT